MESEQQIGFLFSMPLGETMEIRSSKPIDEDVALDEEIEDVFYKIYWNNIGLPWRTRTRIEAMTIALGCQYGANEMYKKKNCF